MTSIRRLERDAEKWIRFSAKITRPLQTLGLALGTLSLLAAPAAAQQAAAPAIALEDHPGLVIHGGADCAPAGAVAADAPDPCASSRHAPMLSLYANEQGLSFPQPRVELWSISNAPERLRDLSDQIAPGDEDSVALMLDLPFDGKYALCVHYALADGSPWSMVRSFTFAKSREIPGVGYTVTSYEGVETYDPRIVAGAGLDCAQEVAAFVKANGAS